MSVPCQMPISDPLAWLAVRGNPARLRRLVKRLTGRCMPHSTTSRWATGARKPDACAEALIAICAAGDDGSSMTMEDA